MIQQRGMELAPGMEFLAWPEKGKRKGKGKGKVEIE
jgi:hypothetical protein